MLVLWRRIRSPFLLPVGLHACALDDWELFECDEAGCLVCGAVHKCDSQTCPLVSNNGHQVCEITGFCVKGGVFADDGFTTCCGVAHPPPPSRRGDTEFDQIHQWVRDLLCSSSARTSLISEHDKRTARLQAAFVRAVKLTRIHSVPLNLTRVCAVMAASVATYRIPCLLDASTLDRLARRCAHVIALFLHRFLDTTGRSVVIPSVKMQGFVVGVLYLMRSGICLCDSVDILPRVPELTHCLPLENQLQARFRLSTKIITEAENCIKRALRGAARNELEALGFGEQY